MENYEWKQCLGFNKLHATRELTGTNKGLMVTICGLSSIAGYIEPPTAKIKCKNCERIMKLKKLIEKWNHEFQECELETVSRPLIKWLNDNCHPHIKVIVDTNRAELVEGIFAFRTDDYIKD